MARYVFSKKKFKKWCNENKMQLGHFCNVIKGTVFNAEENFEDAVYIDNGTYGVFEKWCTKLGKKNYPKNF